MAFAATWLGDVELSLMCTSSRPEPPRQLSEPEIRKLIRGLHQLYPDADCELEHTGPLELLVATILSAQCTDARVNKVTDTLFAKYPTADAGICPRIGVES